MQEKHYIGYKPNEALSDIHMHRTIDEVHKYTQA